jgi:hypothetical protein
MNRRLWTAQVLLALVFVGAGLAKLLTPADELAEQSDMPGWFLVFIGGAEFLGGLGLVLPGLLRVRRELTTLAAAGLVVIMASGVVVTIAEGGGAIAVVPLAVGAAAAFVAWGRREWLEQARLTLQPRQETAGATTSCVTLAQCRRAWEERLDRLEAYLRSIKSHRLNGAQE